MPGNIRVPRLGEVPPLHVSAQPDGAVEQVQRPPQLGEPAGLAQTLSLFDDVQQIQGRAFGEAVKGAEAEGAQAVLQEAERAKKNQQDFKKAVKEGVIDRTDNPWFHRGAQRQYYRLVATEADAQMQRAWVESDMDDASVDDITEWATAFHSKFLREAGIEANEDFSSYYKPLMDNSINSMVSHHGAVQRQRAIQTAQDNLSAEIRLTLDGFMDNPSQTGGPDGYWAIDAANIADQITARGDEAIEATLVDGSTAARIAAEEVFAAAVRTAETSKGDPYAVLSIIDHMETAQGGKLAKIGDIARKREATERTVARILEDGMASREKAREDLKKQNILTIKQKFNQALFEAPNPASIDVAPYERAMNSLDPEQTGWFSETVRAAHKSQNEVLENREEISQLITGVWSSEPASYLGVVNQKLREGAIDFTTYKDLVRMTEAHQEGLGPLSDAVLRGKNSLLQSTLKEKLGSPIEGMAGKFLFAGDETILAQAMADYQAGLADIAISDPEKWRSDAIFRREQADKLIEKILNDTERMTSTEPFQAPDPAGDREEAAQASADEKLQIQQFNEVAQEFVPGFEARDIDTATAAAKIAELAPLSSDDFGGRIVRSLSQWKPTGDPEKRAEGIANIRLVKQELERVGINVEEEIPLLFELEDFLAAGGATQSTPLINHMMEVEGHVAGSLVSPLSAYVPRNQEGKFQQFSPKMLDDLFWHIQRNIEFRLRKRAETNIRDLEG